MTEIVMPKRMTREALIEFSNQVEELSSKVGKMSARGWCYALEGMNLITKGQFDRVETLINECRTKGYLPIDFTAEEEGRQFSGVEEPEDRTPEEKLRGVIELCLTIEDYYTPDWWDGEDYYIQMIVEKIDLKTLFEPVCQQYKIPIATSKGWSSLLMRATYARRFKEAEERGLKCVLLYCGDFDPDGLRISEFLRSNLEDVQGIHWEDDTEGYDPTDLIIDRFGLNFDFINDNNLTWIDNLETGREGYFAKVVNGKIVQGRTKQGKPHPNFNMPYLQDYLKNYGVRKCEANAIVIARTKGQELCRQAIEKYLGKNAKARFYARREKIRTRLQMFRKKTGLTDAINKIVKTIDEEIDKDQDQDDKGDE